MKTNRMALALALVSLVIMGMTGCHDSGSSDSSSLRTGDTVSFTLIQSTDVHHRAEGTGPSASYGTASDTTIGGYARMATVIKSIQESKKNAGIPTLLVDSGDFLMGTVYDMTLGDVPVAMEFMNLMNYDAITLGNHEFDYGPEALASFFNSARGDDGSGFTVPVIASNLETSTEDTGDDGIEALINADAIEDTRLIELSNGLKIGIIGLLGLDAEADAPLASPLAFRNDMSDPDDVAVIQEKVDYLKNQLGAHIVIALSHSGMADPDTDPSGDDIDLANAVTGIDIIASGHYHIQTQNVVTENGVKIFCAGYYGESIAQLDVTVTIGTGVTSASLENHELTPDTALDDSVSYLLGITDASISAALNSYGLPSINDIIAGTDSDNLGRPSVSGENGMGNLVSDAVRYMAGGAVQTVGTVANGVIRNGFELGQSISFADLYSVLPLGMSPDSSQQNVPGYPLMLVYLTGEELSHMCQFSAYAIAAGDDAFVASLPAREAAYASAAQGASELAATLNGGSPNDLAAYNAYVLPAAGSSPADEAIAAFNAVGTGDSAACQAAAQIYSITAARASQAKALCQGLPLVLPSVDSDYFMNLSGIAYTHGGADGLYQVADTGLYGSTDFSCTGTTTPVDASALYPVVADIYAIYLLMDDTINQMLTALGIPISAKDSSGTAITSATLMNSRLDMDGDSSNGIQEVKEWVAFLQYVTGGEFAGNIIPDSDYGASAMNRISSAQ